MPAIGATATQKVVNILGAQTGLPFRDLRVAGSSESVELPAIDAAQVAAPEHRLRRGRANDGRDIPGGLRVLRRTGQPAQREVPNVFRQGPHVDGGPRVLRQDWTRWPGTCSFTRRRPRKCWTPTAATGATVCSTRAATTWTSGRSSGGGRTFCRPRRSASTWTSVTSADPGNRRAGAIHEVTKWGSIRYGVRLYFIQRQPALRGVRTDLRTGAGTCRAGNRIPAVKLTVRQQLERPARKDKTGTRTYPGTPAGLQETDDLRTDHVYERLERQQDASSHVTVRLFQAALEAQRLMYGGGMAGNSANPKVLTLRRRSRAGPGTGGDFGGEIRFVSSIVDAQVGGGECAVHGDSERGQRRSGRR